MAAKNTIARANEVIGQALASARNGKNVAIAHEKGTILVEKMGENIILYLFDEKKHFIGGTQENDCDLHSLVGGWVSITRKVKADTGDFVAACRNANDADLAKLAEKLDGLDETRMDFSKLHEIKTGLKGAVNTVCRLSRDETRPDQLARFRTITAGSEKMEALLSEEIGKLKGPSEHNLLLSLNAINIDLGSMKLVDWFNPKKQDLREISR